MQDKIRQLDQLIRESRSTVFFGGAGVSCESGIPDFRSQDGLYKQAWRYPPETILSATFFNRRTEEFFAFYKEKMLFPHAKPNAAHLALARMERQGLLECVITQNIDGLHQAAGSKRVVELHGTTLSNHCMRCHAFYPVDAVLESQGVPRCHCGGVIKPDVTLYEEQLPPNALEVTALMMDRAELLIVGGTSLSVYPAAAFARDFAGKIVIINKSPTPLDARADLCIASPIGEVFASWEQLHGAASQGTQAD